MTLQLRFSFLHLRHGGVGAECATAFRPHLCLLSFLCPVLTHALSWSLCKKLRVVCSEVAAEVGELNLVSGVSDSTAAPSQHRLCHLYSVGGFGAGHVNLHHNVPRLSHISPQIPAGPRVGLAHPVQAVLQRGSKDYRSQGILRLFIQWLLWHHVVSGDHSSFCAAQMRD